MPSAKTAMAAKARRPLPATPPVLPAAPSGPHKKRRAAAQPDALEALDLRQDSLGYRLRRAQMHAYGLFFEMLGTLELSPARLTALSVIASEPDINQATLAQRLGVAGPSVLKLIDALEGAGFIRRAEVAHDRRRYALLLTPAGRALLQSLREQHAAYEARLAGALTPAERAQLMGLLQRLVDAAEVGSTAATR